jgi:hypothetical protein
MMETSGSYTMPIPFDKRVKGFKYAPNRVYLWLLSLFASFQKYIVDAQCGVARK